MNDIKTENIKIIESTAGNKRFGVSGGVNSQKYLCKFASVLPVRIVVNRHLRQAAGRYASFWGDSTVVEK